MVTAAPARALAGGTPVRTPDLAPWMATLAVRGTGPLPARASCGGALVAPRVVVTAAHCIAGLTPAELAATAEVHVGATTLSSDPGVTRGIVGADSHPRFALLHSPAAPDDPEADSATFDVAVLYLDRPVTGVSPLRLASGRPTPGLVTAFYGHGITAPDSGSSNALRTALFTVGDLTGCARTTPARVDPASTACAVSSTATACFGDSGGPFVASDALGPALVAVFSFAMETAGEPCGTPGPAFATTVAAVRPWLTARLAGPVASSSA